MPSAKLENIFQNEQNIARPTAPPAEDSVELDVDDPFNTCYPNLPLIRCIEDDDASPASVSDVTEIDDEVNFELKRAFAVRSFIGHWDAVLSADFRNDLMISAGQDSTARVWRISTGEEIQSLRGHRDAVTSVCFVPVEVQPSMSERYGCHPNQQLCLSASLDCMLNLWLIDRGSKPLESLYTFCGITRLRCFACLTSGETFAIIGNQAGNIEAFDLSSFSLAFSTKAFSDEVVALNIDEQSRRLFAASKEGKFMVWNLVCTTANVGSPLKLENIYASERLHSPERQIIKPSCLKCAFGFSKPDITNGNEFIYMDRGVNLKSLDCATNRIMKLKNRVETGCVCGGIGHHEDYIFCSSFEPVEGVSHIHVRRRSTLRYITSVADDAARRISAIVCGIGDVSLGADRTSSVFRMVTVGSDLTVWNFFNPRSRKMLKCLSKWSDVIIYPERMSCMESDVDGTDDDDSDYEFLSSSEANFPDDASDYLEDSSFDDEDQCEVVHERFVEEEPSKSLCVFTSWYFLQNGRPLVFFELINMGPLKNGDVLSWEDTKQFSKAFRRSGIRQFIHHFPVMQKHSEDILKWGDELECMLVKFNHSKKQVRLLLKSGNLLAKLRKIEEEHVANGREDKLLCLWRPEYCSYMIENSPGQPFGCLSAHLNLLEKNMNARREDIKRFLGPDEKLLTLTAFPRLGCFPFTEPVYPATPGKGTCESYFFPDEVIQNFYPRFFTINKNLIQRRGAKPSIFVPIFQDKETPSPFAETFFDGLGGCEKGIEDHIFMDAMGFGAGCCCLQITFQACNMNEARHLYDQLTNIAPLMLALTAAAPIYRGLLSTIDCRWPVIMQSHDDRSMEELGIGRDPKHIRITKSRASQVSYYLSPAGKRFNDVPLEIDECFYSDLREGGVDDQLAKHIAHLFIRDPLILLQNEINDLDSVEDLEHFHNIHSSNWQTLRLKPPEVPIDGKSPGWRIEFRPCEIQFTDFENAAFTSFIVLLTRAILSLRLDFIVPMSKVNENISRAVGMNAAREQKFWFRKNFLPQEDDENFALARSVTRSAFHKCVSKGCACGDGDKTLIEEGDELIVVLPCAETDDIFPGLIPLIESYLNVVEVDVETYRTLGEYLRLISQRAAGQTLTPAQWIRNFVRSHPAYKQDSVVSEEITYDLLMTVDGLTEEENRDPLLFGSTRETCSASHLPASIKKVTSARFLDGVNA
ncbi:unnamed protein product [Notodromas monacha]|uniref:Glutamate--cysteine ligase n=1 Tax=Notodromas monacha TaxID=399045 RepID=A0A7R9BPI1_9CRUS|nr:unnamed protein product [Notodromas monacha]CAG0917913.1 unnamed protein product [Notodromas monacha]